MPRYFFHSVDGRRVLDLIGTHLPDHNAARKAGIRHAGKLMSENPDVVWDGREFLVEVTDRDNELVFTIVVRADPGVKTRRL